MCLEHLFHAGAHLGWTFPFSIPSTLMQGSGHSRAWQIYFNPGMSALKGLQRWSSPVGLNSAEFQGLVKVLSGLV